MHKKSSSCKWGALIGMCFLGAIGLQLMVVLMGIAVSAAIGNEYHMIDTAAKLFSWPVFFLSLLTVIIIMAKRGLQCCFMSSRGHCSTDESCGAESKVSDK